MTVPIDLCVAMQGPNVDVLARVFFGSMLRVVNLDGITLHIVDNGIQPEHLKVIHGILDGKMPWNYHDLRGYDFKRTWGSDLIDLSDRTSQNTGYVCEWMLDNCGTNKWCLLSHFDLHFKEDIIGFMRQRIRCGHGVLGTHSHGMMMVHRDAWKQCRIPFPALSAGFYVVPRVGGGNRIRCETDLQRKDGDLYIGGFDIGQLFEMILPGYGWTCDSMEDQLLSQLHHMRSGSGYQKNYVVDEVVRWSANDIIGREGF